MVLVVIIGQFYFDKDKNLVKTTQGQTSKIEYQGHNYVVWSINMGGGIVHDPDCKCHLKETGK